MTKSGALVEIQGIAERHPIAWTSVEYMKNLAQKGIAKLFHEISAQPIMPDAFRTQEIQQHTTY
jgi:ribonuclease PH